MKSTHWITIIAFTTALAVLNPPPLHADEHYEPEEEFEHEEEFEEEIPFPGEEETLRFMREEIPVAIEILELIRQEEGEEEYAEVLRDFRGQYHEYLEIELHDGPEAAELALEGARLELRMDKALHEYHDGDEGDAARGELEGTIRDLVRQQWEHARKVVRMELDLIDRHRAEVEAELKELEAMDEDALKAEVAELLELGEDEEDWEEDEDEEEDEEDEGA